jgi:hypothetical protein
MGKRIAAVGLVFCVIVMSIVEHAECGQRELCEIKAPDLPHTEESVPAPTPTMALVPSTPSSSRSPSVHHLTAVDLVSGPPEVGTPELLVDAS